MLNIFIDIGVSPTDLLQIFVSVVRPVMEYACQVWHTCLPKYLSDKVEMVQKRSLRAIFPGKYYTDILS